MKAFGSKSIAALLVVLLDVLTVLFWIALVAIVAACVAYAVLLGLIAADVLPEAFIGGSSATTQNDATLSYDLNSRLAWQRVLPALSAALVAIGGGLIVIRRLKHVCANFRTGEPFRRENAEHLRVIWITLLVIEVSRFVLFALTALLVTLVAPSPTIEWNFKFGVDLSSWGAILVVIILAEVFREGARLREEQDLTI